MNKKILILGILSLCVCLIFNYTYGFSTLSSIYGFKINYHATEFEFFDSYEAESGTCTGTVVVNSTRSNASNDEYVSVYNKGTGNSWSISIDVPYTEKYSIIFNIASDFGYKLNNILIDGKKVGSIDCVGNGVFEQQGVYNVTITAGIRVISLGIDWGQIDIDKFDLISGGELQSESTDYYRELEAEYGSRTNVSNASTRVGASNNSYVTNFLQNPLDNWTINLEIPYSQKYNFIIRTAGSNGEKINYLVINGTRVGTIITQGTELWEEYTIYNVSLTAGLITIRFEEDEGYIDLDKVIIMNSDGTQLDADYYSNITTTLSNENANEKTVNIYNYLNSIYGEYTLAGQYSSEERNLEIEMVYETTGKYSAIRGFDMIFYVNSEGTTSNATDLATEWSNRGGLVTYSWHWKNGVDEEFYTANTDYRIETSELDLSCLSQQDVYSLYENSEISYNTYLLIKDIDTVSQQLSILQDNGVSVLWRPLHEASSCGFWWGASGSSDYIWLWQLMYNRMTSYHNLNNLIWVYNGQSVSWYPGDNYVDLVGQDVYTTALNYTISSYSFKNSYETTSTKAVALTECSVLPLLSTLSSENVNWLYFCTWSREYVLDTSIIDFNWNEKSIANYIDTSKLVGLSYQSYHDAYWSWFKSWCSANGYSVDEIFNYEWTTKEMWQCVYNNESVITLDELPSF